MGRLYDFYEQRIFPHILDVAMKPMERLRAPTLAPAEGAVLEIGFGTGLNLRHYPPAVKRLAAIDPMDALAERVAERVAAVPFPVERRQLRADGALPYETAEFDTVAVTFTLCTIPEPLVALAEALRVLKPGGRLLFVEHGRSEDPGVARWQDRLNPIQNVIGCGCNLNRAHDQLLQQAGFDVERLERFCLEGTPAAFGTIYQGAALRP